MAADVVVKDEKVELAIKAFLEAGGTMKNLLVGDRGQTVDGRPIADASEAQDLEERQKEFVKGVTLQDIIKTQVNFNGFAFSDRGREIQKALGEGVATAGGYLTPPGFVAELIEEMDKLIELTKYVRSVPVKTDSGYFPAVTTSVTISDGEENVEKTETTPVFGQVTWSIHKKVALTKMSLELLEDSAINLQNWLTEEFSTKLAEEKDKMVAIGNGTTQALGLVSCANITAVAVGGAPTYEKLVDIEHTLAKQYRKGAIWCMNTTNVARIRKIKDTAGTYIFVRGRDRGVGDFTKGAVDTLLGYPIAEQNDMPDGTIFFFNPRYYWLFPRGQVRIASTDVGGDAFKNDQLWIKCTERYDGKCVLAAAFAKGTGVTA